MNNRLYKKGLAIVLIIAILIMAALGIKLSNKDKEIIFTGFDYSEETKEINEKEDLDKSMENKSPDSRIFVDIDGAVENPGVYQLKDGDRVNDAIIMAGGLTDIAYTKNLNKARKLVDGEKVYILKEGETTEVSLSTSNLININTALINDLMSLPGIGEVYAQRIIDYRNEKLFVTVEEIKKIEGIGDKTFDKLKDLITIN